MILIATQCFPPKLGGIESYMHGLAEAAACGGASVRVFADGAAQDWDAGRAFEIARFEGWRPLRSRRKAAALRAAIAETGADRLFLDSWKSLETALLAVRGLQRRPRLIALAHGMELPAAPGPLKRRRMRRAFAAADAILANSRFTAERAAPYLPPQAPIRVAPPPIPPQPEPDAAERARLRARLSLADGSRADGPLLVGLGRLEPRKGFDHVIAAAGALKLAHPGLRLALAGDGPDRARLEALAQLHGAPAVFLGRVSEAEKAALLAEAALFAMPARAEGDSVEGFGVVYLEAAWHGAPALAGRVGGAADAVLDGATGWLCDGASPAAVLEALGQALGDPVERHRRGYLAKAHARDQLWSARIGDYLGA